MYIKHTNQPTLRSIHNGCFIFGYICGGGKAVKISLFYISRKSTDQENLSRFPNLLVSIIFCQIRHHWSGWQAMTVQTSTRNLLNKLKFQTIIQDLSNIYILIRLPKGIKMLIRLPQGIKMLIRMKEEIASPGWFGTHWPK